MTARLKVTRRSFATAAAVGIVAAAPAWAAESENKYAKETGAVEDMMREHGVLRRALLVYTTVAQRLRQGGAGVDPNALKNTAILFRDFGERYHERLLEEEHIFPVVRHTQGEAAAYPDILTAQHNRGREITQYIVDVADRGRTGGDAESLARSLDAFVAMYRNHAAREDTIVFPAWKKALPGHAIVEMGDQFEKIERRMFGHDGFEDAVKKIAAIEQSLGLADLAQFTAPAPSRPS
jgi:hemerythrin-like domain-containing protein